MSDRPAGVKATRSPWTDGAWIMLLADMPDGWEVRRHPGDEWHYDVDSAIVEARPVGGAS
jgi:hypothetical protein